MVYIWLYKLTRFTTLRRAIIACEQPNKLQNLLSNMISIISNINSGLSQVNNYMIMSVVVIPNIIYTIMCLAACNKIPLYLMNPTRFIQIYGCRRFLFLCKYVLAINLLSLSTESASSLKVTPLHP